MSNLKLGLKGKIVKTHMALLMFLSFLGRSYANQKELIQTSGVQGGLVVQIGCEEAHIADLTLPKPYIFHGLDESVEKIASLRKLLAEKGAYGPISLDSYPGKQLPYQDRVVNLLLVMEKPCSVSVTELLRVLAPRGVLVFRSADTRLTKEMKDLAVTASGECRFYRKPVPPGLDEWTHFLHNADNNAVSKDQQVGPPRSLRWQCGPLWSRSHETDMSLTGAVVSQGRIIYFIDEGPIGIHETPRTSRVLPDNCFLVGRDAFSGVELWRRPVPGWGSRAWDNYRTFGKVDQLWSPPWTLPRRLVAVGKHVFVTLGYRSFLSQLDAATGQTTKEFKELGTVDELLVADNSLILRTREITDSREEAGKDTVVAVDIATAKPRWQRSFGRLVQLTLASSSGRVVFCEGHDLVCLSLDNGRELWRTTLPAGLMKRPYRIQKAPVSLILHKEIVAIAGDRELCAYSALDGKSLWRQQTKGTTASFRGPADILAAQGLLWVGALSTQGLDPMSGKVARNIRVPPHLFSPGHHARCHRSRGTANYLLRSKQGVELVDLTGNKHSRNNWLRGTCRYGFIPAYGMLYMPPSPCFCYPGVMFNGFNALAPATKPREASEERLNRGPAYGRQTDTVDSTADWPCYRHDMARSGAASCSVSTNLKEKWRVSPGKELTPPVLAQGRLVLADKAAHAVFCLDSKTGRTLWRFVAGGPVDSVPTLHNGLVLFGCTDGWVYCVDQKDGSLRWRFRAAPYEQRIVSYGHVQSSWPVHGSVLVKNDVAYVVAGRSSFVDGGLYLYGLDVLSGTVRYQNRLDGPRDGPGQNRSFWMDGGRSDLLVCANDKLYMMQNVYDLKLNQLKAPTTTAYGARKMDLHLVASGGFLDTTGFDRNYWMHAAMWPGFYFGILAPKTGQILVFDDENTYALHTFTRQFSRSPYFAPGSGHNLVADRNDNEAILPPQQRPPHNHDYKGRWKASGHARKAPPLWEAKITVRARSMVLANDTLFLAGPPDRTETQDPLAGFEGRKGALLRAYSTKEGKLLKEYSLDSQPVFDALIAAQGALFMCMKDGTVRCWSEGQH